MSEEIKEILYLQNYIDKYKSDEKAIIKGNRLTTPAMLDYLEVKALLNYITNLQQKVEQLEKENEATLKNYGNLVKEWNQLENIRKEAIEYIEEWQSFPHTNCTTHNELKNLLNILNKGE